MPENRRSLAAYVRTRTHTNVLPRVLPPADQKTASFRGCTQPAGWDSCSTRHQYTIGMVSECTDVQRVVRYVGVRCHTCRPAPANQLQIHATRYEAPGLLLQTRGASTRQMLRPLAIGHPITRPHGNGCIGVNPHRGTTSKCLYMPRPSY